MALVPLKVDRASKPPIGTHLRSDGHWAIQGLHCFCFQEGGGSSVFSADGINSCILQSPVWTPNGVSAGVSTLARSYAIGGIDFTYIWKMNAQAGENVYPIAASDLWGSPRVCDVEGGGQYMQFGLFGGVLADAPYGVHTFAITQKLANNITRFQLDGDVSVEYQETNASTYIYSTLFNGWYSVNPNIEFILLYPDRALTSDQVISLTRNPWQIFEPETVWISTGPSVALNQHSFRFFADNGSESASTALAAINTSSTLPPGAVARIRALIDATGDPTGKTFQLEYRRKPSGGAFGDWTKVT